MVNAFSAIGNNTQELQFSINLTASESTLKLAASNNRKPKYSSLKRG